MSMNKYLFAIIWISVIACTSPEKVKFERYRVAGERLYAQQCAGCHQLDGSGFQKLYPPLSGTDWMKVNFEKTICSMKYGLSDTLEINGITYTLAMAPSDLSNLEIAEISTYIFNKWGNEKGIINVADVGAILNNCD